jgi:diguanylate cyclase (GGDEF)-like protein/PAS domain S-box-containing protein
MSATDSEYSDAYEKISDITGILYTKQQAFIKKYHEKSISSDFNEKMLLILTITLFLLVMILGYVITLRHRRLQTATLKSKSEIKFRETQLSNIITTIDDCVVSMDERDIITYVNDSLFDMFGYTEAEVVGSNIKMLMPPNISKNHDSYLDKYEKTGNKKMIGKNRVELAIRKNGEIFPIRLRVTEVMVNGVKQFTGVIHDLSETYRTSNYNDMIVGFQKLIIERSNIANYYFDALKYSSKLLASSSFMFVKTSKGIDVYTLDKSTDIDSAREHKSNKRTLSMDEFKELQLCDFLADDNAGMINSIKYASGVSKATGLQNIIRIKALHILGSNDSVMACIGVVNKDVAYTDQNRSDLDAIVNIISSTLQSDASNKRIKHLAERDSLTGLYNRDYLNNYLRDSINNKDNLLALVLVDCDKFKKTNDFYGHDIGDKLLRELARVLNSSVSNNDAVFRVGGDEFVLVLNNLSDKDDACKIVERIYKNLSLPILLGTVSMKINVSMGVSIRDFNQGIEKIFKQADLAMFESKKISNTFTLFSQEIYEKYTADKNLERFIEKCFKENLFYFNYQPQICTTSEKLYGIESLIRCDFTDNLKSCNIGVMVEKIYALGQADKLNKYVTTQVLEEISKMEYLPKSVSINISPVVHDFTCHIKEIIDIVSSYALDTSIEIEFTEAAFSESLSEDQLDFMRKLFNEANILLAIDDFGVEHSSMSRLIDYSIDTLKIDKSLVDYLDESFANADKSRRALAVISSMVSIAKQLDISVVAEGVETENQCKLIKDIGCDLIQGYYFYKPMSLAEIYKIPFVK